MDVLVTLQPAEAQLPVCVRQHIVAVDDDTAHEVRETFGKVESACAQVSLEL